MFKWLKGKSAAKVDVLEIAAPLTGVVVPLANVPDEAFSSKAMGEGVAIEPSEGKVVAPFDGKVAHLIEKSKHAVILEHASGVQVLIHIGVNTVSMKGEGFKAHVSTGDDVKAGQLLIEFDMAAIQAAGYPVITPVLIPSGIDAVKNVVPNEEAGNVTAQSGSVIKVNLN
ncbi:PTS glucose transporter subunit IIA [Neobacillus mesonae]|nr:PTS glucose transporter subunit IIA [Neobacillus mesonae]